MRTLPVFGVSAALALALGMAAPRAADCEARENVQFVCGQNGPEDLAVLPGSEWVVSVGDTNTDSALRLVNVKDKTTSIFWPTTPPKERLNQKLYGACPGPMNPAERNKARTHGVDLRPGSNNVHTLYVVHHGSRDGDLGSRESVEVFEVDARTKPPTFTWIGCVVAPDTVGLNAVVGLPDGGIIGTNFSPRGSAAEAARAKAAAGQNNGELWEWHPDGAGWKMIPGSESSSPNGLVMSKDGKWLYIAGYGNKTFVRVSRGQTPPKREEIQLTFKPDNLRWAPDGMIFATGQDQPVAAPGSAPPAPGTVPMGTSVVAKVNPETLKVQELVRYPYNDKFRFSTVTVQIGNQLWVGSNRDERIAIFPADQTKK